MPTADDIYSGGSFFKADGFEKPLTLTITNATINEVNDQRTGKPKPGLELEFKESDRMLRLNKTNYDWCCEHFGTHNYDQWIGKKFVLLKKRIDAGIASHGLRLEEANSDHESAF